MRWYRVLSQPSPGDRARTLRSTRVKCANAMPGAGDRTTMGGLPGTERLSSFKIGHPRSVWQVLCIVSVDFLPVRGHACRHNRPEHNSPVGHALAWRDPAVAERHLGT